VRATASLASSRFLIIVALFSAFLAVVLWFDRVDFYNRHFFDPGAIVVANNAARILFVAILSWLIYAPGAGIARLIMSSNEQAKLTPAERAVLGFGVGVGIWHVAMLVLGILNLYYRMVMVGLCLAILIASASHFANVAVEGWRTLKTILTEWRQRFVLTQFIGWTLVTISAAWLLVQRGLYPGGSGDYYTHYFYYYLEVLKNHGLTPNDAWYHYYYSKGSGLAFLGMLLTDPEAPALTTYPCVVFAALAIVTLTARMVPNSLWPAAGASVYLLFYLLGYSSGIGEAEFQKHHEVTAALVVLTAWSLCMERAGPARPFQVMAGATAVAAAITTQAVGILLGLFIALLGASSIVHRQWKRTLGYLSIAAVITAAVLAVFVLSYLATGLASDQPLGPMLYFADFKRLDQWGVIPQIIAVAWIRNNFEGVAPLGWSTFVQLVKFMRLVALWPFLTAPFIVAIVLGFAEPFAKSGRPSLSETVRASFATLTAARLVALLGFFAVVALIAGRVQNISFGRLSTFFVPLVVMFGIAGSAWILTTWQIERHRGPVTLIALPIVLLVVVMVGWQISAHWTRRAPTEMANALRFLTGHFSLAEAYKHTASPYAFGGINPGALAAARQLPSGTPIWSTNIDSYCMVPGCQIESVISFKMSGRLDEILGGDPELAKRRLQEAGLNYFLFMKEYRLVDLLPFSRLFAPDMIGRYLGVKWTDGSTFLLTWLGPEASPIGSDFLEAYARRRAEPDVSRFFRFDESVPQIVAISPRLRNVTRWGREAEKLLTWRQFK
jgi:hypothetical protein